MKHLVLGFGLLLAACNVAPLLHEDAPGKVQVGMTGSEVEQALGVQSYRQMKYRDGTSSWSYKYRDSNIAKLLHVTFGPDGHVTRTETEWDPDVYSKKP